MRRAGFAFLLVGILACGGAPEEREDGPAKISGAPSGDADAGDRPTARSVARGPSVDQRALDRMNFELVWDLPAKKSGFTAMTLAGDAIYAVTADHILYSIDVDAGIINWIFPVGEEVSFAPVVYEYPREPEAGIGKIDEVYLLSGDRLRVIDKAAGSELWHLDLPFAVSSPPAVTSTRVIIGSWDNRFYAIRKDPPRGKVWHWLTDDDVVAPGVGFEPIYIGVSRDGGIYAFSQQRGEFRWKQETLGPIVAAPEIHRETGKIYVGSTDYTVYCVDLTQAEVEWRHETGGPIRISPVVIGDAIYVIPEDRKLTALRRTGARREIAVDEPVPGDTLWQVEVGRPSLDVRSRAQVLARGRENVYVLNDRKEILAIHHDTGETIWEVPFRRVDFFATNTADWNSPHPTEKSRAGTIYIGLRSGWFYALREKSEY